MVTLLKQFLKNLIVGLFSLTTTVVCAQADKVWYRPATIPEGFKLDRDACVAANANKNGYTACMVQRGWTLIDAVKINADRRECREKIPPVPGDYKVTGNFYDCLREKGWDDEFESAKRLRINQLGVQDFCSIEKYADIVKRAPCNSSRILLEHLADDGRVSENDRSAWLEFFNKLGQHNAEYREILRPGPMLYKKAYELHMRSARKIDDLRVDVVMGKITIGEYKRARKDIRMDYDAGMVKVNEEVRAFINSPAPSR